MSEGLMMEEPPGRLTYQRYPVGHFPWRPAMWVSLYLMEHMRLHWVLLAPLVEKGAILMTEELWLNV